MPPSLSLGSPSASAWPASDCERTRGGRQRFESRRERRGAREVQTGASAPAIAGRSRPSATSTAASGARARGDSCAPGPTGHPRTVSASPAGPLASARPGRPRASAAGAATSLDAEPEDDSTCRRRWRGRPARTETRWKLTREAPASPWPGKASGGPGANSQRKAELWVSGESKDPSHRALGAVFTTFRGWGRDPHHVAP